MKIIITGGAGFIGSHLAKRLLQEGHKVLIIDELHPYYSINRKLQQLKWVKQSGEFSFVQKSLLENTDELAQIFKEFNADCLFHLAALPGVAYSIEAPNEYIDYDIKATVNTLRLAGEANIKRFIFASSSSVYGNQHNRAFSEEMATGKVISPYAAAKYSAESFCHVYEKIYGYQMNILRFFTVYGPWGRPDLAISKFIHKLMKNEEITLFGQESQRDYTYIDDIIDGILLTMTNLNKSEILNLGSGKPVTLEGLVEELKLYFPNMVIKQGERRLGDVDATWADLSKARRLIGFEPKMDFKTGIAKTVKWALEHEEILS